SLFNSLIGDNSASRTQDADVFGPFNSKFYNVIGIAQASQGFTQAGSNPSISSDLFGTTVPLTMNLEPLADNGGYSLTHNLGDGSPAIDRNRISASQTAPAFDQRKTIPRSLDYQTSGSSDYTDAGAVERVDARIKGILFAD